MYPVFPVLVGGYYSACFVEGNDTGRRSFYFAGRFLLVRESVVRRGGGGIQCKAAFSKEEGRCGGGEQGGREGGSVNCSTLRRRRSLSIVHTVI